MRSSAAARRCWGGDADLPRRSPGRALGAAGTATGLLVWLVTPTSEIFLSDVGTQNTTIQVRLLCELEEFIYSKILKDLKKEFICNGHSTPERLEERLKFP
ncbi:hypothetical protein U9M48_032306 [Paspalum notatum var. saurae]|uniref:Uncharacterized protein n=1 Tax=Paspalum notatum var. saurae TaxID=547442 RepID=A0AAQ3U5N8_PASNO